MRRYIRSRPFKIVGAVKMSIVYPRNMDAITVANDWHAFVQKHAYAHVFESWHHPYRVMVAKHTIDRFPKPLTKARHSIKRCLIWPKSRPPIIARQNTNVVIKVW